MTIVLTMVIHHTMLIHLTMVSVPFIGQDSVCGILFGIMDYSASITGTTADITGVILITDTEDTETEDTADQ